MAFTWNAVFVDEAHNDTKKTEKPEILEAKKKMQHSLEDAIGKQG
jgi:hypothetical protein